MTIPFVGSLPVLVLILLIGVVFILCVPSRRTPREAVAHEHQQHHRHLEAGHSYLYYRDRKGCPQYEEDGCQDCLAKRAEQLKQQGLEVTECVLGTKRSSDL